MEIKLNIPEYNSDQGLQSTWENGFEIESRIINNETVISANQAGLISLARQLLTLAQAKVPAGAHFHYDNNYLEEGSEGLIIQKI